MYSTRLPQISNEAVEFGTSGLLYRSNKLMYDRRTETLWRHFTGEPVVGRLADSGIVLKRFPVTLTTWGDWLAAHPETTVLSIETGVYPPQVYLPEGDPGAAYNNYFSNPNPVFPVWQQSDALPAKATVFGVIVNGAPKAYDLLSLVPRPVLNDSLGGANIAVVTPPGTSAARAYLRGNIELTEAKATGGETVVTDTTGRRWRMTEEALVRTDDASIKLARMPTHFSFWFGWYAAYPNTQVYTK